MNTKATAKISVSLDVEFDFDAFHDLNVEQAHYAAADLIKRRLMAEIANIDGVKASTIKLHVTPSVRLTEAKTMSIPRAWAIIKSVPPEQHHPDCSHRKTFGGTLCDCPILTDHPEYVAE